MASELKAADDLDDLLTVRVSRVFPVPKERVYEAWTTAELLAQWWGPKGYEGVSAEADPRPGGAFECAIKDADGGIHRMRGVYTELEPYELICMEIRHRQFEGAADRPEGYIPTHVRVELKDHEDGTELLLTHTGFLNAAQVGNFDEGWNGSFDKLETALTGRET